MIPHQQGLLSFGTIRQLWQALGVPLYPVQLNADDYPGLDAQTLAFLDEVGYPEAAEPGLDFTDLSEKLFTHTQLYHRDDFPVLDQYLVIGANAEGNPVCIDTTDGTIVFIDHDHGFESVFINTSLMQLSYCMAVYGIARKDLAELKPADLAALSSTLEQADKACLAVGNFWEMEIGNMDRELNFS